MKFKVNGIKTVEEARVLLALGVEIFSFSTLLDPSQNNTSSLQEPRFLSIEEINQITQAVRLPNVSVYIEIPTFTFQPDLDKIDTLIAQCKPNYVELDQRYDPFQVPLIYRVGLQHDDSIGFHYDLSKDLEFGLRELFLEGLLQDWKWLRDESPKYSDSIKIVDVLAYFSLFPNTILNIPMVPDQGQDILSHIPAKSISFSIGNKKDDRRNYSFEEVTNMIQTIKENGC